MSTQNSAQDDPAANMGPVRPELHTMLDYHGDGRFTSLTEEEYDYYKSAFDYCDQLKFNLPAFHMVNGIRTPEAAECISRAQRLLTELRLPPVLRCKTLWILAGAVEDQHESLFYAQQAREIWERLRDLVAAGIYGDDPPQWPELVRHIESREDCAETLWPKLRGDYVAAYSACLGLYDKAKRGQEQPGCANAVRQLLADPCLPRNIRIQALVLLVDALADLDERRIHMEEATELWLQVRNEDDDSLWQEVAGMVHTLDELWDEWWQECLEGPEGDSADVNENMDDYLAAYAACKALYHTQRPGSLDLPQPDCSTACRELLADRRLPLLVRVKTMVLLGWCMDLTTDWRDIWVCRRQAMIRWDRLDQRAGKTDEEQLELEELRRKMDWLKTLHCAVHNCEEEVEVVDMAGTENEENEEWSCMEMVVDMDDDSIDEDVLTAIDPQGEIVASFDGMNLPNSIPTTAAPTAIDPDAEIAAGFAG